MKHFLPSISTQQAETLKNPPPVFFLKPQLTLELTDRTATQLSLQRLVEETLMKACTMLGETIRAVGRGWDGHRHQTKWNSKGCFLFLSFMKQQVGFLGCFETTGKLNFSAGPSLWLCRESACKQLATWQASHHVAFEVYSPRCSYHSSVLQENLALTFPWKTEVFSVM